MNTPRRIARRINPKFSRYLLRIGRSAIHRFGVFAVEAIPRGRKVIEYAGERPTWCQAVRRVRKIDRLGVPENVYLARFNRHRIIDGAAGGSGAQFINHSCDPNLSVRRIRRHLLLFSRRRIHPAEELTVDYRFPRSTPGVPCRCGALNCRGTINWK